MIKKDDRDEFLPPALTAVNGSQIYLGPHSRGWPLGQWGFPPGVSYSARL